MPRLIQIRRSPIHGKGVFALADIPRGLRIIEYRGARITHAAARRQHPVNAEDPFHTFLFALSDGRYCIDAGTGGNAARWINHRCAPNCEAVEDYDRQGILRVYLHAKRLIRAGEELSFDYSLQFDHPATEEDRRNYLCRCRSWNCRRTMLATVEVDGIATPRKLCR
ncbi:SET domain-containing protein [Paraburkholderia sp. MM5477-R1]|uniref:SET domain-containing protein n=1 Tax=Paraburkholderia sp. MM5477-R1 TaxID=2991062 RepID=UPI003D20C006